MIIMLFATILWIAIALSLSKHYERRSHKFSLNEINRGLFKVNESFKNFGISMQEATEAIRKMTRVLNGTNDTPTRSD